MRAKVSMNVLQRDADRLLRYFRRPIYLVLFYYLIGMVFLGATAYSYFSQKNEGDVWVTTGIAFWVLLFLFVGASLKLLIELMIPKYRKQYFRPVDRSRRRTSR